MSKSLPKILNELKTLKRSGRILKHPEFVRIINRAGYTVKHNGNQHCEVYRDDGTKPLNSEGMPLIFSGGYSSHVPGHYRKIISAIIDDLESREA